MNAGIFAGMAALLLATAPVDAVPNQRNVVFGPRVPPAGSDAAWAHPEPRNQTSGCCVILLDPSGSIAPTPYSEGTTASRDRADRRFEALAMDELPNGIARLRWQPDGRAVREVALFLADEQHKVLAVKTLQAAPYVALFRITYDAPYAGVKVVYADGQTTTSILPYVPR